VKNFSISLFLSDLMIPLKIKFPAIEHKIEELRHMNLVNFDEKELFQSILDLGDVNIYY
jgi:hypothetical protein